MEADLVAESTLKAEYTRLLAGINVEFAGEQLNLSALARYATDPDRSVRHAAATARWNALGECAAELDRIFDQLVHLRDGIARKLGYATFTDLGYARMQRIDYDRSAVERYRDAVVADVVPLACAIAGRAARRHGIAHLAVWDEHMLAAAPAPHPLGDAAWIMERTVESFADLDPRLGEFARLMDVLPPRRRRLLPVVEREAACL